MYVTVFMVLVLLVSLSVLCVSLANLGLEGEKTFPEKNSVDSAWTVNYPLVPQMTESELTMPKSLLAKY